MTTAWMWVAFSCLILGKGMAETNPYPQNFGVDDPNFRPPTDGPLGAKQQIDDIFSSVDVGRNMGRPAVLQDTGHDTDLGDLRFRSIVNDQLRAVAAGPSVYQPHYLEERGAQSLNLRRRQPAAVPLGANVRFREQMGARGRSQAKAATMSEEEPDQTSAPNNEDGIDEDSEGDGGGDSRNVKIHVSKMTEKGWDKREVYDGKPEFGKDGHHLMINLKDNSGTGPLVEDKRSEITVTEPAVKAKPPKKKQYHDACSKFCEKENGWREFACMDCMMKGLVNGYNQRFSNSGMGYPFILYNHQICSGTGATGDSNLQVDYARSFAYCFLSNLQNNCNSAAAPPMASFAQ